MDGHSLRILRGLRESPATCGEISTRLGIPPAACYRRMHELARLGLVRAEPAGVSRNGKPRVAYRSRLRSVQVRFEDGRLLARVALADERDPGTPMLFEVLRSSEADARAGPSLPEGMVAPWR